MSKKIRNERCQRPPNTEESYEFLPTGLETNTKSRVEKFATLNPRERDYKLNPVDRGFSNSDRIVPNNPIQGCNEVIAPSNKQQKMKISSRLFSIKQKVPKGEDKRKVKENDSYEINSLTESNSKRLNFNCQFPQPNGPVGNEGFSDGPKQEKFDGYEIEYEEIDRISQPPKEMSNLSRSPMGRLPWYATNGQMFDSTGAPIEEQKPGLEGPQEDYMDMEPARYQRSQELKLKLYDEVPDDAPLPPMRMTISYATVHSHALPILRKQYHNKIPKASMRVDSKRTVQKIIKTEEKFKKSNSYDSVLNVNPSRSQLKKVGSGFLPDLVTKAINNRPTDLPGNELSEALSRRKETMKILNIREEEPEQTTSNSNDDNQHVFYQLSDVLPSDRSKKTVANPTEVKSQIEETTVKVPNNSKPIDRGNRNHTLPLAKVNPETPPKGKIHKSKSESNNDQNTDEQYMPQKMIINMIAREKRAQSVIKKVPPPIPTKRRSFCKETLNNNTSMEDKSVMEDKKGINNLVQDLENKLGLNQKSMLDSFSSKSYFPKQLNEYQDPPMNLKHVESTNAHNKVYYNHSF